MDVVIRGLRDQLPDDVIALVGQQLKWLEDGDFAALLASSEARQLLGHDIDNTSEPYDNTKPWNEYIFNRLSTLLADREKKAIQIIYFLIGYAALLAFTQASVTGPPLPFDAAANIYPASISSDRQKREALRQQLLASLSSDGAAVYKLTTNVELLCLADVIFSNPAIVKSFPLARWIKIRVNFTHQRLLSEVSSAIQQVIYDDLKWLEEDLVEHKENSNLQCCFLLERAAIHIHHGLDKLARSDIEAARAQRQFDFRLTGRLGKRTKYQQNDISQLVVLAKSAASDSKGKQTVSNQSKPENLDLNDDTLLERIAFTEKAADDVEELPESLASLDPSDQPLLDPLDSTILLCFASSITNTSPEHGLTREELLPYANRVLDGGSSNWQIYTQALLVRSRVEGYKSRTVERGLLQLQALVDQVIAETTSIVSESNTAEAAPAQSTFLPRAKPSESAPVTERLQYIFQLATPMRWELEAELAARWSSLGGLKSALDIYERLEMWAEAALCLAATENEEKGRRVIRRQLFHRKHEDTELEDNEKWEGAVRDPPPLDAPRLYCILGDLDQDIKWFETAWEVSKQRYARAQRSLGRHYFRQRDYEAAVEAYAKSLKVNQTNHQGWFALGCALIELEQYPKAVEAFSRCVQLDDTDAEAWSNLAAALLRIRPDEEHNAAHALAVLDDEDPQDLSVKPVRSQQNRINALKAFQRAASIKHGSYQIWQNVLVTAASLSPPDWPSVLSAQRRVIELRGETVGEACIDTEILEHLVQHIIASSDTYDPSKPGIIRMTVKLMDEVVVPQITGSAILWRLVGRLALWRKKPAVALDAEEKAWRAITTQPGWETGTEERWNDVVEATVRLCDSYESFGPMERSDGLAAGSPVASDWKFKARSAIRGIMNKGKDTWEGTAGWERLVDAQQALRG